MTSEQYAAKIIKMWDSGKKDKAKELYMKAQMAMSSEIKVELRKKLGIYNNAQGVYVKKYEQHAKEVEGGAIRRPPIQKMFKGF